jgi:hypothetical protein
MDSPEARVGARVLAGSALEAVPEDGSSQVYPLDEKKFLT